MPMSNRLTTARLHAQKQNASFYPPSTTKFVEATSRHFIIT
uniref:Uncharacterized protein n=1 Tax=Siphoviridae sp. ctamP19 TaxID=2827896 RepID=A0A8S5TNB5_9CAUD|nr:MAG TPA: hypothetical protein [Siphoviridae sp. ctamP19]